MMDGRIQEQRRIQQQIDDRFRKHADGEAESWVQWKGTDICVDLTCVCGADFHFDGMFLYYWRCMSCNRVYGMSPYVQAIEIADPVELEYVEKHGAIEELDHDAE
jgi:hypothetical protein